MKYGAKLSKVRHEIHPHFVFQIRMNQIFENIPQNGLFYTDTHEDAKGSALYFTFRNGVDPDPNYCGEIEGVLYKNRDDELVLKLKNERVETFLKKIKSFEMEFFDPKENTTTKTWNKDSFPPIVYFFVDGKKFSFLLPKAIREVKYK